MKLKWFIRKGIFYIPASVIGWVIFAIGVISLIYIFMQIDSQSHSVSDTLINFVFNALIIGLCYTLVAWFTAKKEFIEEEKQ